MKEIEKKKKKWWVNLIEFVLIVAVLLYVLFLLLELFVGSSGFA